MAKRWWWASPGAFPEDVCILIAIARVSQRLAYAHIVERSLVEIHPQNAGASGVFNPNDLIGQIWIALDRRQERNRYIHQRHRIGSIEFQRIGVSVLAGYDLPDKSHAEW